MSTQSWAVVVLTAVTVFACSREKQRALRKEEQAFFAQRDRAFAALSALAKKYQWTPPPDLAAAMEGPAK